MNKEELEFLGQYRGTNPMPEDFEEFWALRVEEAQEAPLQYSLEDSGLPANSRCKFMNLWFQGLRGECLYAKYIKPECGGPVPLVLQFHGYPGSSRSWLEQASYAGMGCALLALDCPGQGGLSWDTGGYAGPTASGHVIAGLEGPAKDMYYVRLHQNICILCRIVKELDGIDRSRIFINGASQGGGLGIACAALNPDLPKKAAILYPFLSDYQKVWELGADEVAYEGLRYYCRWADPDGSRRKEIFTKLGYVDTHNFARMVKCNVLFGLSLSDTICPPATQMAVYNNLNCKKRIASYPEFGHEEIQEFDDLIISFFGEEG